MMGENVSPEFIEAAKKDPGAFGRIYDHYYSIVLNYFYRQVLDVDTAEELTSRTFFNVVRSLPKYRQKTGFTAWIYKIALNEARMQWPSNRNRGKIEAAYQREQLEQIYFEIPDVEQQVEKRAKIEQFQAVLYSLGKLPEKFRQPIILRYIEGMNYEDIGQVLRSHFATTGQVSDGAGNLEDTVVGAG